MTKLRSFLKYQFPAILWCVTIFGLSAIPHIPVLKFPIRVDKLVHGIIYLILCFLVWRALFYQNYSPNLQKRALLFAFLFSCLYGILDEIHQLYVPGRSADVYDALADATGAFLFVAFSWRFMKHRSQRQEHNTFDMR